MRADIDQDRILVSVPPALPRSSVEFVNLFVHFYRGEMGRGLSWRDRIDRTTNWAITVVAGMLSFSLSTPNAHHSVLIFAMMLAGFMLVIEARRYRFFDFYRNRIRRLERNYYAAVFSPDGVLDPDWGRGLAEELRNPEFSIGFGQAVSRRLRRTYVWIFLIILIAWLLKISSIHLQATAGRLTFIHSFQEILANADIGPIPGWVVISGVALFYALLIGATLKFEPAKGERAFGDVYV
ncbi:DUF2270 domain-containing protein [Azospirillum soli]|uniref:DUF2270 domain-containing protein n=1 Tax=Azospirillum soli TaxID=1304799 RepID=UPI001AE6C0B4|nr:DUF2270 domain-containing protein [Azospirillum soli]MBP2316181.1 putative membrane protein [Azospirillum soli]